jgi:outer membrane protein assembly factor BamB
MFDRIIRNLSVSRPIVVAVALVLGTTAAKAAAPTDARDWPQWRGPIATGAATGQANPPTEWSETRNVRWKVAIPGAGTATPIVWGDQVFIQTAINTGKKGQAAAIEPAAAPVFAQQQPGGRRGGGGRGGFGGGSKPTEIHQFVLMSLDRKTGKTLWQRVCREEVPHEGHHQDHGFSSFSPVTDGQLVFAHFGSRGLHCFDLQGNPKWSKDLGRMQTKMGFGEGSSPAVHGDAIVVTFDHEGGSFITALDKNTGKELWKTPRDESTSWATPLIVETGDQTQVITAATSKIRSYDLKTGRLIWECGGLTMNVIPTPVARDGILYIMSGFRGYNAMAIELGGATGDLSGTGAILWSHKKSTPYVPSPLLSGDRLYFISDNKPVLSCLDIKTGKPLFDAKRIEELEGVYASPVAAGNHIYLVGRNGPTAVLRDNGSVEVIATNNLDDRFDASPAVAGSELFLRGHKSLYCIAEK